MSAVRHGTADPQLIYLLDKYRLIDLGVPVGPLSEEDTVSLVAIHRQVRRLEDEKWDRRIKAILRALGVKVT